MDILKEEDITIFAKTNFRGEEKPFGIKLDDRRRHMYIIGKTGMGKSVLLKNLAIQDIQRGRGVAFVDPHGDSAEEILQFVPKSRINDVVYFNPADLANPIAFNILEAVDEDHKHLIASGMMGVFKKIWPDVWSPRMEYILNNTILALLDYPGSTMLGLNRMMADQDFRREVISKVRDPIVRSFWLEEFGKWDQRFAREATAAIQNKVGQFISTPIVRHIVGQTTSTINMREIMDEGKILIVNLAKGRIGEEAMALLGGMVVTRLYLAAMERVDVAESTRRDFFLYVDEFQNFATESFASILSEARKYRLSLIVAHQYITQLTEEVRDAVFGNVGSLLAFRVGAADAEFMEKEFEPMVMMNDLINLPKYQIYLKLMIDGVTGNAFSAKALPPFPEPMASYADKVIQVSQERYGRPRKEVEEKISKWMEKDMGGRAADSPSAPRKSYRKEQNEPAKAPIPKIPARSARDIKPARTEKFMSPSQIVGFNDQETEKVEKGIKQEIAKVSKKNAPGSRLTARSNDTAQSPKLGAQSSLELRSSSQEQVTKTSVPSEKNNPTDNAEPKIEKAQTVWQNAVCDRCGKETKVPFKPEEGRGIFCKECLREVRRQRAFMIQTNKEKTSAPREQRTAAVYGERDRKTRDRVSEEQKEKYKEDLRAMLAKIKGGEEK
ncbi:MAG: CxxC-x17-CxxC domain-containing protein [Candidatus Moraniibacteriota bacterium]